MESLWEYNTQMHIAVVMNCQHSLPYSVNSFIIGTVAGSHRILLTCVSRGGILFIDAKINIFSLSPDKSSFLLYRVACEDHKCNDGAESNSSWDWDPSNWSTRQRMVGWGCRVGVRVGGIELYFNIFSSIESLQKEFAIHHATVIFDPFSIFIPVPYVAMVSNYNQSFCCIWVHLLVSPEGRKTRWKKLALIEWTSLHTVVYFTVFIYI